MMETFQVMNFSLQNFEDMQMDVKDMSFFPDESFGSVIDKGTFCIHLFSCYMFWELRS